MAGTEGAGLIIAAQATASGAMRNENWIADELDQLRRAGLERQLREIPLPGARPGDGAQLLNFASNDYLGLCRAPEVVAAAQAAAARWGAGAAASRLVTGTLPVHTMLEERLASLKGYPAAVLFGSGYMANLGIISAIAGRRDWVVADRLAHASMLDAAILSRAELRRFRHNDPQHLEEILRQRPAGARCLVLTESVFSMEGDCAPLREIAAAAAAHGAMLLVDEAHATGVFGPGGAGLAAELNLNGAINISMGTLSKALGSYGGFCACSAGMRNLLINRARALIFSTAPPPPAAGAALAAMDFLAAHPNAGRELLARAAGFRTRLQAAGFNTGGSNSQIVPVILGDNRRALDAAAALRRMGILAPAIRPPTVPAGSARIRFSVTLAHAPADLEKAADALAAIVRPA